MTERPRLAVIGAGPAGLAAALAAAAHGVDVTLVDSAREAGGQFFRRPEPGLEAHRSGAPRQHRRTWRRLARGLAAYQRTGAITFLRDAATASRSPTSQATTLTAAPAAWRSATSSSTPG
ncbi:NAD(P)-binding protein, partial [Streptomyces sp. NPDC005568]|uniref:NAD(P)-binding protein n=1 Tax=Streptomyces sp. NPDC005568 TaxID=3156887 RepID=UPI0033BE7724